MGIDVHDKIINYNENVYTCNDCTTMSRMVTIILHDVHVIISNNSQYISVVPVLVPPRCTTLYCTCSAVMMKVLYEL